MADTHNRQADVPESSVAFLRAEFRDSDGNLSLPTTIHYEIKNLTTGAQVRPQTLFTPPAAKITIPITSVDNVLGDQANPRERRGVTVIANLGLPDQVLSEFRYAVLNSRSHPA